MTAAAKKIVSRVSFTERFTALVQELLEDATPEEQGAALTMLEDRLNARLDVIAEQQRPKGENGIPVGFMRLQLDARGHGKNPLQSFLKAIEES